MLMPNCLPAILYFHNSRISDLFLHSLPSFLTEFLKFCSSAQSYRSQTRKTDWVLSELEEPESVIQMGFCCRIGIGVFARNWMLIEAICAGRRVTAYNAPSLGILGE